MGPIQKYVDKTGLCNGLYNARVLSLGSEGEGCQREQWCVSSLPQVVARLAAGWAPAQATTAASLLW